MVMSSVPVAPRFEAFVENVYRTPAERAEAAALPIEERQMRIKRLLIKSPQFKRTSAAIQRFHMPVKGGVHDRGRVCGIVGESRSGKSWAIQHYVSGLGMRKTETALVPRALYVDVADGWNSSMFASTAARTINLKVLPKMNAARILDIVSDEVVEHGVELVVIDDVQYLLASGHNKTISEVQGFLAALVEKGTCNVVLSGTELVERAVTKVSHLVGRGGFPVHRVEPFEWNADPGANHFLALLEAIDERLPFRESSALGDVTVAAHLYFLSEGVIGRAKNYVEDAAYLALNDKAASVTREHLYEAAQSRRRPDDPYVPFKSKVDIEDPLGNVRAKDADDLPKPHLTKRRGGRRGA